MMIGKRFFAIVLPTAREAPGEPAAAGRDAAAQRDTRTPKSSWPSWLLRAPRLRASLS